MRIQDRSLWLLLLMVQIPRGPFEMRRIALDHNRFGLRIMLRTLFHRARGDVVSMVVRGGRARGGRRRRGGGGKVQLTFWHSYCGRDGLQHDLVVDQVLSAFVLGRQVKLDRLPLVAALLQAAVVERRHRFSLRAVCPNDAPSSSAGSDSRWRVTWRG